MRFSDIIGGMGLSTFPQIALVIFLIVFIAVTLRVLSGRRRAEYDRAAMMPLDDDSTPLPKGGSNHARA